MQADPVHAIGQVVLITPLGHDVEHAVDAEKRLQSAGIGRVGVKDFSILIPEEDAEGPAVRFRKTQSPWRSCN